MSTTKAEEIAARLVALSKRQTVTTVSDSEVLTLAVCAQW